MKRKFMVVLSLWMFLLIFVSSSIVRAESKKPVKITVEKTTRRLYMQYISLSLNAKTNRKSVLTYQSADPKIVKVTQDGMIYGLSTGKTTVTITAAPKSSLYRSSKLNVTVYVMPWKPRLSVNHFNDHVRGIALAESRKGAESYEFQIASNSAFRNPKVRKNKSGRLSFAVNPERTYYVRARSKANNVYSSWSDIGILNAVSKKDTYSWQKERAIIHALGGLEETSYLNSKESFITNYQKGNRLFEVDLEKTSDGVWVCRHDWRQSLGQWKGNKKKVLSLKAFRSRPILGKYTPISFEDLLRLLAKYPDAYVMLDSKKYSVRDYDMTLKDYGELVKTARDAGLEEVLDQLIPQVYKEEMYPAIRAQYHFPSYVYPLWKEYSMSEIKRIAKFCSENEIYAVTIQYKQWTKEIQKIFDQKGIYVYVYTMNDFAESKKFLKKGVKGICTDFLSDQDFG